MSTALRLPIDSFSRILGSATFRRRGFLAMRYTGRSAGANVVTGNDPNGASECRQYIVAILNPLLRLSMLS